MHKLTRWITAALALACTAGLVAWWMPQPVADLTLRLFAALGPSTTAMPATGNQAIVVLGGRSSRALKAAAAARATHLPVYVAGAELVPVLVRSGVKPTWAESISIDTRSNAAVAACMLQPLGIRRIALVTDPIHMPRASLWFRRYGFEVTGVPSPIGGVEAPPKVRRSEAQHEVGGIAEFLFLLASGSKPQPHDCARLLAHGGARGP